MSDQLPSPQFDSQNYARPNEKWICGNAAEGRPCRFGPDKRGRCQATAECIPVLDVKPGETKGRWRCTRIGGPCESGPLPDGTCCRPVAKCSPVPTLRTVRGRITGATIAGTLALLLIFLGSPPLRNEFINPGELSTAHSGEAFARGRDATNPVTHSCAACHQAGAAGPSGIVAAGLRASPGMFALGQLAMQPAGEMTGIDAACQKCHTTHKLHQPNVIRDVSCSYCHAEHRGSGPMPLPTDAHCAICHGDADAMAAAAAGPATDARVVTSFAGDHPEFRAHREQWRDSNTLKFGHALHLTGQTIPPLPNGEKLDCRFCHEPDASGTYFRPIRFEENCRVCHSLQFDVETPDLNLPHGDPEFVSAFLHSLSKQYADTAARRGITGTTEQRQFVQEKLRRLQAQVISADELERRVFFNSAITDPGTQVGTVSGATRALYPGCAYCHEVTAARGAPIVTEPLMNERWFVSAQFDHAKHSGIACTECHQAQQSRETADVILPRKDSCVTCHSPRGGVANSCATCHAYHDHGNTGGMASH